MTEAKAELFHGFVFLMVELPWNPGVQVRTFRSIFRPYVADILLITLTHIE